MFRIGTIVHVGAMALALSLVPGAGARAQPAADPNGAPNPYRLDKDWLKFPEGRKLGQVNGVDIDPDGKSVWVFERCGKRDCVNSPLDPIKKFDAGGQFRHRFRPRDFQSSARLRGRSRRQCVGNR